MSGKILIKLAVLCPITLAGITVQIPQTLRGADVSIEQIGDLIDQEFGE